LWISNEDLKNKYEGEKDDDYLANPSYLPPPVFVKLVEEIRLKLSKEWIKESNLAFDSAFFSQHYVAENRKINQV